MILHFRVTAVNLRFFYKSPNIAPLFFRFFIKNNRTKWPDHRNIFSFDRQFLLGIKYQTGTVANPSKHEEHYIWTYDLEDFFNEYKKQTKELKTSRPKEILYDENWEYMKLTLKC